MTPALSFPLGILAVLFGTVLFVLLAVFVLVPVLKWVVIGIAAVFRFIGRAIMHVVDYVAGTVGDVLKAIGSVIAGVVLLPLVLFSIVFGRWSAAGHFTASLRREVEVFGLALYRACLKRPLRLVFLDSILEGVEQRVPEAMAAAPGADRPSRRTGVFDGYRVLGSLKAGGSGAKLYVAEPLPERRGRREELPDKVVIKSFTLTEGSELPQIVRESRALECAKRLGLVVEHHMDKERFWYVMPFHDGEHLGVVVRQTHARSGDDGLAQRELRRLVGHVADLTATLHGYHREGLWHKDVKPENVIVHDGRAHLVDLGLVTPLASAMTLTTHGTEYFRDPEMVKQALRGVKVHQVDGVKFDVYGIGAVLYFAIENEFPAHGPLSRFAKRSPDAIRWIVRRAMADYQHRYDSAAAMLADLRMVLEAKDPYAIRPAELPSMSGRDDEAFDRAAVADASSSSARTPSRPAGPPSVAAAAFTAGAGRPRLRVANWWTGAYDSGPAAGSPPPPPPVREQVGAAAAAAANAAVEVANAAVEAAGTVGRAPARAQRRAARRKVAATRRRAHRARHRHAGHWARGRRAATAIGIAATCVLVLGLSLFSMVEERGSYVEGPAGIEHTIAAASSSVTGLPHDADGLPVLLVAPEDAARSGDFANWIRHQAATRRRQGQVLVADDLSARDDVAPLIRRWMVDSDDEELDEALEDALAAHGYYGILFAEREGRGWDGTFVYSTREGAGDRRRADRREAAAAALGPAPEGRLLLVNDHPGRHSADVSAGIAQLRERLQQRGWTIAADRDAEAQVRRMMSVDPVTDRPSTGDGWPAVLAATGYDGVLRFTGDLAIEPSRLVRVQVIDADGGVEARGDIRLRSKDDADRTGGEDHAREVDVEVERGVIAEPVPASSAATRRAA